ncbi:NodT family efflux transporter outer membrane factor (OMF) lipoprotein [Labrys monachus]|uniref:NodT family efflux transporter outer membrane factor (OMF) lipoprotein n=1 Tax=Labrys monachus TaxID=217067 RepID=A0ABU0F9S7_9HYPH|nr:NodT family efflux transporter outer membrane factor (OMF) lipoprotein [Labrys monachus]
MTGCAVGPDFAPPGAPQVSGYTRDSLLATARGTDIPRGNAQAFATGRDIPGQWWRLYHSKQINALVEEAIRNHPDLKAAQAALRQAREIALAGRGSLFPQASTSQSVKREQISGAELGENTPPVDFNLFNSTAAVSYVPDVFGGTARSIEATDAATETAQFQLEATYLALTANVVTAAINDASLVAQIKVTREIADSQREQLKGLQVEYNLGAIGQADIASEKAELAQTLATLPPLLKARAQQRDQLMAYLGRFPSQDNGEAVSLDGLTLPAHLPVSVPARLVRQRPDIRQAESRLHQASAEVGVSLANMLPQITLSAGGGAESLKFDQLFNSQTLVWNLAGGVTAPLFDGGTLYHRKEAASAALDQATQQYKSTVITAFENVADSIKAVQYDAEALKAQADAQSAADDSLKIARAEYKAGATNYITMLNAEQTALAARTGLVKAQAARFEDTAALLQALGGGWWNRVDETKEAYPRPAGLADTLPVSAVKAIHARRPTPAADSNPDGNPKL